jgi:SAM-dependent methyltransferase
MRLCPACHADFPTPDDVCPACGKSIANNDGIVMYAPELAAGEEGYQSAHFSELVRLEEGSFWFRARNALIIWALKSFCPGFRSLLEVGCGTGYVLKGIESAFPAAKLCGSEISADGLAFARARVPGAEFIQMDARAIPFVDEFDAIGCFDVLEHMAEDNQALAQIQAALKPGGILVVTVPQHPRLWSPLDDSARHQRRYGRTELDGKIKAAGFDIKRSTSFVSLLLPFVLVSRLFARMRPPQGGQELPELEINPILDRIFAKVMTLEFALIRAGLSFPAGSSRLVVARKPGAVAGR